MSIPTYQVFMRPVLSAFADGATSVKQTLPFVIKELAIPTDEAEALMPSGKETVVSDRAHWARTYLSKAGLLESPKRNYHRITSRGREYLARYPEALDKQILMKADEFRKWIETPKAKPEPDTSTAGQPALDPVLDATPDDTINGAVALLNSELASEVLAATLQFSPQRFERLILDLLRAMGYGGGEDNMYRETPRSGDGGIDGVINEDALGLDAVYIQAKRYVPENKIGREALQAFVGSLTGEGASKGVFVTTSGFSGPAIDYVDRIQQRIVLIDGDRLARLMIQHDVGVRVKSTFVVREIDENYFNEHE